MKKMMRRKLLGMSMVLSLGILAGCGNSKEAMSDVNKTASSSRVEVEEQVEADEEFGAQAEEVASEEQGQKADDVVRQEQEEGQAEGSPDYEYRLDFKNDTKVGINAPEGYEVHESQEGVFYHFINTRNTTFAVSPQTEGYVIDAYNKYLETGEWNGVYDFAVETFVSERTVDFPEGTAMIITATDEFNTVQEHCYVSVGENLIYISRSMYSEEEAAKEETMEEIIQQLFAKKEVAECKNSIQNVEFEITEGQYEHYLREFGSNTKDVLGFNFPFEDFTRQDEPFEYEGVKYNVSYEFANADNDLLTITMVSNLGQTYSSVALIRQYLKSEEYPTELTNLLNYEYANLIEMKKGPVIETSYGKINIVYSLWRAPSTVCIKEVALFMVNGEEFIVTYEDMQGTPETTLDTYEGTLETMLPAMFN